MNYQTITVKKNKNKAILMLNQPEILNAITKETLYELQAAVDELNADKNIQIVIIGAEGTKAFSVGGNIKEEFNMSVTEARKWSEQGHKLTSSIENSDKVYIAAIHGYTIGAGCEIAIACDFRLAADNTLISVPAIKLGMICGFGGNVRLPRLIGKTKAKELLMTGNSMDAEEAYRVGFLNQIVPREQLLDATLAFSEGLTNKSSAAMALAKKAIDFSMNSKIENAIINEIVLFTEASQLHDRKEGMSAFIEKRTPKFTGR